MCATQNAIRTKESPYLESPVQHCDATAMVRRSRFQGDGVSDSCIPDGMSSASFAIERPMVAAKIAHKQ